MKTGLEIFLKPKKNHSRIIFQILVLLIIGMFFGHGVLIGQKAGNESANPNLLWYRQPAIDWNEALPIGNGRLGGMVFGGIESERIQLNEDTIWAGEKRDRNNPEGLKNLALIRRLLFAGKAK